MIYYKAWMKRIEKIRVASESSKFIFLPNGRKCVIDSDGCYYRPTWKLAKMALLSHALEEVRKAQKKLDYCALTADKIRDLEEEL